MSAKSAPFWWLECDRCGKKSTQDSDFAAWSTLASAIDDAINGEWSTQDVVDGEIKALCEECGPFCENDCGEPAGELSGMREYMCQRCFDAHPDNTPLNREGE